MKTVNVLFFRNDSATSLEKVASFPDDEVGNSQAEALLSSWLAERHDDPTILKTVLDDGYFECASGVLLIAHSTE